jgi:hypothetical protein
MAAPSVRGRPAPARPSTASKHRELLLKMLALAGILVALAGTVGFTAEPPQCSSTSASGATHCTSTWETFQWVMIGGVLVAVPSIGLLARLKMQERLAAESVPSGEPARPAE